MKQMAWWVQVAVMLFLPVTGWTQEVARADVPSGKIHLAARLLLPEQPVVDPPPVLVIVHGSGKEATWDVYEPLVDRLLAGGVGVAFFDKRGTGESAGKFLNLSVKNSAEVFDQLSDDVVAVAEWVARQPGVSPDRIGLFGLSQGGWIAPLAANKSATIRFTVMMSGPVASLGEEKLYSKLMAGKTAAGEADRARADEALQSYDGPDGFDATPEIAKMAIPGFWMFGAADASMPVDLSRRHLDGLIGDDGSGRLSYRVYPDADHSLYDVNTGQRLDYIPDMVAWVGETVAAR